MLSVTNYPGNAIKTVMQHHLTPVRMAVIKKTTDASKDVKKREPLYTLNGHGVFPSTMENNIEFPQTAKNSSAI